MSNPLIGLVINELLIADDKHALLFKTSNGDMVVQCEGDCCSTTWVESVELPALGFPATVISVADLDGLPEGRDDPEHEYLQFYGCKIVTDRGEIVIDYRNSSNGYYGGSLVWPGEYAYLGVFGQNESGQKWVAL